MRKTWLLFSQAVTVAVAMLFVVATLKPQWLGRGVDPRRPARRPAPAIVPLPAPVQNVALIGPGTAAIGYSAAAKRASPAVVSITASRAPAAPARRRSDVPLLLRRPGPADARRSARSASARA